MVADQVFGGLFGAVIVGYPAAVDPIAVSRERVLVISDISFDSAGRIWSPATSERMLDREGELILVNCESVATMSARPAERERWRIVNACAVPARSSITVRVAFERFAGGTAYRCHILDHEDLALMGVLVAR